MINKAIQIIKENKYFFMSYFIVLLIGLFFLLAYPKGEILLNLNKLHTKSLDYLFVIFSNIGDGIYYLFFLLLLAIYRFKYLILGVTTFLGSGAITQILKFTFDLPRPIAWFDESVQLNLVEGIHVHQHLSFPSGHSTAGFSIFLFIALIFPYKPAGMIFLLFAIMVAFARVYLAQHFFVDIYFGSLIGVFGSLLFYSLWEKNENIQKSKWYNYSLIKKFSSL